MNRNILFFAPALAMALAAAGGAEAGTVYIPEGSAGTVAVVDSAADAIVRRITSLADVHGLGGGAAVRYLVAGSFTETTDGKAPAVPKPPGISDEEHAAHHGAGAQPKSPAGGAVSILTILDARDGAPVRRLEVPGAVHHVAVSPDGRHAVATHPGAGGVSVVDLSNLAVRGLIRTGAVPNYAVFGPGAARVYVSNGGDGTVSEIGTAIWSVRRTLPAGETPEHMVLSPDGRTLYVANVQVGTVSALDLGRGAIARSFAVGGELHGLDLSDDGATLFVTGKGENKLVAIDLGSGRMRSAPLGPAPYHLAVIRGTGKLYVSSREEPKVWVVDQASLAVRGVIAIRGEGHQMVVAP